MLFPSLTLCVTVTCLPSTRHAFDALVGNTDQISRAGTVTLAIRDLWT